MHFLKKYMVFIKKYIKDEIDVEMQVDLAFRAR